VDLKGGKRAGLSSVGPSFSSASCASHVHEVALKRCPVDDRPNATIALFLREPVVCELPLTTMNARFKIRSTKVVAVLSLESDLQKVDPSPASRRIFRRVDRSAARGEGCSQT